ncbi:hypothetical protein ABPG74_004888, partial [Tetrahymena malaccensis]
QKSRNELNHLGQNLGISLNTSEDTLAYPKQVENQVDVQGQRTAKETSQFLQLQKMNLNKSLIIHKQKEALLQQLENSNFQQKQEILKLEQIVKNAQTDLQKLNLQGTLIAQLEQQNFQLKQEIQKFEKADNNKLNNQPIKLKEITIEKENFLQPPKQAEVEIIQNQVQHSENYLFYSLFQSLVSQNSQGFNS